MCDTRLHHAPHPDPPSPGRRDFLRLLGGCAANLTVLGGIGGTRARALFADTGARRVVQEVPWGRLEEVADGIWAMVSTPLEDRTTLCNGGIVSGRSGVVLVEAFGSPQGAVWMAEQARALTGRWPDHVVVTHYHGDHSAGLPGCGPDVGSPRLLTTAPTRELTRGTAMRNDQAALLDALERVVILPTGRDTHIDLGGRTLVVTPREGHTASDVTLSVVDPAVVFGGDLVWNQFFPNYMDANPTLLTSAVRGIRSGVGEETVVVPGHGPVGGAAELTRYLELLERVEAHAREAHGAGWSAEEAAATFVLPNDLEEWFRFSPAYPERALGRWLRELASG